MKNETVATKAAIKIFTDRPFALTVLNFIIEQEPTPQTFDDATEWLRNHGYTTTIEDVLESMTEMMQNSLLPWTNQYHTSLEKMLDIDGFKDPPVVKWGNEVIQNFAFEKSCLTWKTADGNFSSAEVYFTEQKVYNHYDPPYNITAFTRLHGSIWTDVPGKPERFNVHYFCALRAVGHGCTDGSVAVGVGDDEWNGGARCTVGAGGAVGARGTGGAGGARGSGGDRGARGARGTRGTGGAVCARGTRVAVVVGAAVASFISITVGLAIAEIVEWRKAKKLRQEELDQDDRERAQELIDAQKLFDQLIKPNKTRQKPIETNSSTRKDKGKPERDDFKNVATPQSSIGIITFCGRDAIDLDPKKHTLEIVHHSTGEIVFYGIDIQHFTYKTFTLTWSDKNYRENANCYLLQIQKSKNNAWGRLAAPQVQLWAERDKTKIEKDRTFSTDLEILNKCEYKSVVLIKDGVLVDRDEGDNTILNSKKKDGFEEDSRLGFSGYECKPKQQNISGFLKMLDKSSFRSFPATYRSIIEKDKKSSNDPEIVIDVHFTEEILITPLIAIAEAFAAKTIFELREKCVESVGKDFSEKYRRASGGAQGVKESGDMVAPQPEPEPHSQTTKEKETTTKAKSETDIPPEAVAGNRVFKLLEKVVKALGTDLISCYGQPLLQKLREAVAEFKSEPEPEPPKQTTKENGTTKETNTETDIPTEVLEPQPELEPSTQTTKENETTNETKTETDIPTGIKTEIPTANFTTDEILYPSFNNFE